MSHYFNYIYQALTNPDNLDLSTSPPPPSILSFVAALKRSHISPADTFIRWYPELLFSINSLNSLGSLISRADDASQISL